MNSVDSSFAQALRKDEPLVPERRSSVYQIDLISSAPLDRTERSTISRKEVIQPQVLLQLPCYDFTPITNHTLGTCLPCGLAQQLLVQPAFVM